MIKIIPGTLLHKAAIAVAIILLPIFVTFLVSYNKSKIHMEEDTLSDLTDQASVFEGFVYQFLDRLRQRTEDFSSDGVIRDSIGKIINGDSAEALRLSGYLARYKLPLDRSVHSIAIVSLDGRVMSSTDGGLIGKDLSGEEFLSSGREKATVAESGVYGARSHYVAAAAPIFSKTDGKTAGVIVNLIPVAELNLLLDRLRAGAHEKEYGIIPWDNPKHRPGLSVFIVNRHNRLISKPASVREAAINQAVDIASVRECLSQGRESSGFYDSFLNARVAGASMCMPSLKWTLILEVREDEVLKPVADLRRDALITGAVVTGLLIFFFAFFYRVLARPVKDLAKAADAMAKGDYTVAVYTASRDEIGTLASAFNRMAVEIANRTALLKESADRLSAVVENSAAAIYMKDVGGRYILVNRTLESLLKLKRGDIIGKTDFEVFPEEFAGRFAENDRLVLESKEPHKFDEDAAQEDGIHHYVSIKVPIFGEGGEPVAVCGISTDITERKRNEDRIEKLSRLYFVLSRISEAIVRTKDAVRLYEAACRILVEDGHFLMAWVGMVDAGTGLVRPVASCCGIAEDCLENVRISVMDEPEGRGPAGTAIREGRSIIVSDIESDPVAALWRDRALETGCRSSVAFPIFMGAGAIGAINIYAGESFFFKEEEMKLLDSIAADLSFAVNSIELEDARLELQMRFEELLNNLTIGVFRTTVGGDGRFIEANPALVKMLGASSKEALLAHRSMEFYYDKGKRDELIDKIKKYGFFKDEIIEIVTLKNTRLWVVSSAVLHRDKDGNACLDGIVEDITQKKRMEEHLVHSQKMEAVGQLAAGVAHDFNNILTAIIGYANLLNMGEGMDEQAKGFANKILVLSERAADLTSGLMAFSREKKIKTEPIELNALIKRFSKMIQRMLGDNIEYKTALSDAELTVMADASQMEQVFLAIASNAKDAMPEGGIFSISTGVAELDDEFIMAHGCVEHGKFAFAAMTDTGIGMDEATTARIFEPFFTTKEEGRGTGLGLPVGYGIIRQHGGFIETYSKVGEGTTFMIYIPLKGVIY